MKLYALRVGLVSTTLLAPTDSTVCAQAGDTPAEFVLAGFQDGRERLRSGTYKCRGTKVEDDPVLGRLEGSVDITSSFDYDNNLIRFDRKEPVRAFRSKTADKLWTPGQEGGTFIKTSKRTIRWFLNDQKFAVVGPATYEPPLQLMPLDIRILGACTYTDITNRTTFPDLLRYLKLSASGKVVRLSPTQLKIAWSEKIDESEMTFDESAGFSPVRYEVRFIRPAAMPRAEPHVLSTAHWKKRAGVWVPTHVSVKDGVKPSRVMSYDLVFEWDNVNERLPAEMFAVSGMDLPTGTPIVSNEMGGSKVVQLGTAGDKAIERLDDHPGKWSETLRRSWPFVLAPVLALAALATLLYYRRSAKISGI